MSLSATDSCPPANENGTDEDWYPREQYPWLYDSEGKIDWNRTPDSGSSNEQKPAEPQRFKGRSRRGTGRNPHQGYQRTQNYSGANRGDPRQRFQSNNHFTTGPSMDDNGWNSNDGGGSDWTTTRHKRGPVRGRGGGWLADPEESQSNGYRSRRGHRGCGGQQPLRNEQNNIGSFHKNNARGISPASVDSNYGSMTSSWDTDGRASPAFDDLSALREEEDEDAMVAGPTVIITDEEALEWQEKHGGTLEYVDGQPSMSLRGKAFKMWEKLRDEKLDAMYLSIDQAEMMARADRYEKEKWAKYPAIVKNVYVEHPEVANMSPEEVDRFRRESNGITVTVPSGMAAPEEEVTYPNPIPKMEYAFHNYPELVKLLGETGFEKPSPIQAQAWPMILKGHDVIGIAQTGSGKTLAFLLPAYVHIMNQPKQRRIPGAHILVIAPTRELAVQIHTEVSKFPCAGIKSIVIYGGVDRQEQIRKVKKGCNIIIATPGRLDDLVSCDVIDITSITYVVLDEADRMLDDGFEGVIRKTLYRIRPDRQTIMTSATWPDAVRRLAVSFMKNPAQVTVGTLDLVAVATIRQEFIFLQNDNYDDKLDMLLSFAREHVGVKNLKVIVFVKTKILNKETACELLLKGYNNCCIRGDMDQEDRETSIEMMVEGEAPYLIATGVASRGIDIPNVTHVINMDFPRDIEEYVHRIGRTGRAGRTGHAITFLTKQDWRHAPELIKIVEKSGQPVPPELISMAGRRDQFLKRVREEGPRSGGRGGRRERRQPSFMANDHFF